MIYITNVLWSASTIRQRIRVCVSRCVSSLESTGGVIKRQLAFSSSSVEVALRRAMNRRN